MALERTPFAFRKPIVTRRRPKVWQQTPFGYRKCYGFPVSPHRYSQIKTKYGSYISRAKMLLECLWDDRKSGPNQFHDRYSSGGWQGWKVKL